MTVCLDKAVEWTFNALYVNWFEVFCQCVSVSSEIFLLQVVVCTCSVQDASSNGAGYVRKSGIEIARATIGLVN